MGRMLTLRYVHGFPGVYTHFVPHDGRKEIRGCVAASSFYPEKPAVVAAGTGAEKGFSLERLINVLELTENALALFSPMSVMDHELRHFVISF